MLISFNVWKDQVDVYIEFMDEECDRFSFQYFYPTIKPEDKRWYHACLKKGEGRAVSLNMRQSVYKPKIMLPRFHVRFVGAQSGNHFEWHSEKIMVNQQIINSSILVCVFNTDYMTPKTSELLYNLLHADMKCCLTATLLGFQEKKQGILFLQELTRTNLDENEEYFSEIVDKVSLKPYNLLQTTKYLEELNIVSVSPNKKGYIVSNLKKYEAISEISNGITSVLENRFAFIYKNIPEVRLKFMLYIVNAFVVSQLPRLST